MPRKPKEDKGEVHTDETQRTNGLNEGQVRGFFKEAEAEMDEIDSIMADAVAKCQPHKDQIKEIIKEAAESSGIPKKVFRTKLRERSLLRRADACRGSLSAAQQDEFDLVSEALGQFGDTPLGKAALDAAGEGATAH